MAVTNFSPLLGLALPTTGDLTGTWGDTVNNAITTLLDSAVAGTTTLSSDADVTLTTTTGASNQARNAIILWTATGTVTRNITAPAQSKAYVVINSTGGTQSIVLRGAGPTTGITVIAGEKCLAAWNGSDFVKVSSSIADGVTSVGGTGTVNGISLTGTVTSTGNLTLGGALTGVNLTSQVTGILPVANGGTATSTPALIAGSGVSISGTWPNQTISATGSGGTITSVTASAPLASSGGTTPDISFTGVLSTANGGTGNANGTVGKLATTNFTIEEVGGVLVFKYGATTIATMDSSGNLTTLANVTAYGTI